MKKLYKQVPCGHCEAPGMGCLNCNQRGYVYVPIDPADLELGYYGLVDDIKIHLDDLSMKTSREVIGYRKYLREQIKHLEWFGPEEVRSLLAQARAELEAEGREKEK